MLTAATEFFTLFPEHCLAGGLVFVVSALLMQKSCGAFSLHRPTIPGVFYLTYLFMIFFPSFFVYRDHPGPYRDSFLLATNTLMLTIPLGIIFANLFFRFARQETENYFSARPTENEEHHGMFVAHFAAAVLFFFILADYLYRTPVIPIFELIRRTSDPMGLTLAREEAFKLMDPRWGSAQSTHFFFAFLFLRTVLFPFLIMTTLGYALYTKKLKWAGLFTLVFLVGSFYAVSSLARAPISAIFMRIFFFLYLFFQARVPKKVAFVFLGLMLAFPLVVTTFANSTDRTLWDGLVAIGIRLTYAPALDLYYYFEIFPAFHDYLHGHTLLKPFLQLAGAKYFYIENFVAMYISPYGVKSAHANAAFASNLHADFGYPGVVLGSFLCGFVMQMVHVVLARRAKTVLNMAVYSFMIYAIWVLNFGSVSSVLLVNGVLPVILAACALRLAGKVIYRAHRKLEPQQSYA